MNPNAACGTCGTPLTAGFCPRCLLSAGVSADPDELPAQSEPPAPYPRLGDYELLEEIGRGGMGIVYRARQVSLDRVVAVKLLPFGGLAAKQSALRLRAEAVAAGSLRHPNIVAIHEVGLHDEQHFIAMDYVPGPSLARLLRDGPLPGRQAAQLIRQVALAVQHAHERGIIHRDLKPSNILLDSIDDQPRITDFGLAKNLRSDTQLTLTGQTLGSPNYIPPEQIRGSEREEGLSFNAKDENPTEPQTKVERAGSGPKISFASDVYALGATLYHALTGRPPFIGHDIAAVLHQVLKDEPLPPRRLNPSVAADLETICLKCLEKEPGHRYATAKEMADELDRFLNDEPIHARPLTRLERGWRWCRRNPIVASLSSASLLLLLIVAIGGPVAAIRINREREQAELRAYTADMNVVQQAWDEGKLARARALLRAYIPKPEQRDLRGFEWRYLWKLCQDDALVTITREPSDPVWSLATSPNHAFVVACGEKSIRLLAPATGRELQTFSYPNPETNDTRCLVALASQATNLLAVHRAEGVVGVWDLATKTLVTSFKPFTNTSGPLAFKHPRPQRLGQPSLALSPDGRLLATGEPWGYGRTLTVWDISARPDSPKPLWSRQLDTHFNVLRFSPDGQTLVANAKSMKDGTIGAWDVRTGNELQAFPKESIGYINDLVFSPDGRLLAAAGVQSTINIWEFTNRVVKSRLTGHRGHINSLTFSLDGSRLISAGDDGAIRVWDISSQKVVGMFRDREDREVRSVAFDPEGRFILSATADEVRIWPGEPRQASMAFQTQQQWGAPVISPDGNWLVTRGTTVDLKDYSEAESAKVWDLVSHRERFHLIHRNKQPLAAVFSPDGRFFVLGGEDRSRVVGVWETALWDKADAALQASTNLANDFEVGSICFSPDGTIMAVAGLCFGPEEQSAATNRLTFREVGTWRKLDILEAAGAGETREGSATTAAFSHSGRFLAAGYRDGWVRLWDIKHQRLLKELKVHGGDMYGVVVSLSNDDRWLASTALKDGGEVALLDVSNPERAREVLVTKANGGCSWSAIFSPDSRSLVTSGNDGLIKFWNLQTLKIALTLEHGQAPAVFINFSQDGSLLASQDANGLLKLWPAASFGEIAQKELERQ
jgi:serine/threonine protein kinase/WD40 repeat protein